jgi:hypothetical protein
MALFYMHHDGNFTLQYEFDGNLKQCHWWKNEGGSLSKSAL